MNLLGIPAVEGLVFSRLDDARQKHGPQHEDNLLIVLPLGCEEVLIGDLAVDHVFVHDACVTQVSLGRLAVLHNHHLVVKQAGT